MAAVNDLHGVFAVPPLPRKADARRSLNLDAAECVARHIEAGGITRFLYGGNAFLYHASLDDFQALVDWLSGFAATRWPIPSIGPSFGRAIDQARILKKCAFRAVMMLPCGDPRDALGMEAGLREIAAEAGMPLILYLKSEDGFGSDRDKGLDAVGRLIDDEVAIAIKYAVVRDNPLEDAYLEGLLWRVDRSRVISGMGERPAIEHLRDYRLGGLTTGSGCIAPHRCQALFEASSAADWARASALRSDFMPLEDLRDAWGPARVLHHAPTGPIPPYVSALDATQLAELSPVARALRERDA
jgi:dihydrodipicolinate synthase/N-acetylneuraminate lyase